MSGGSLLLGSDPRGWESQHRLVESQCNFPSVFETNPHKNCFNLNLSSLILIIGEGLNESCKWFQPFLSKFCTVGLNSCQQALWEPNCLKWETFENWGWTVYNFKAVPPPLIILFEKTANQINNLLNRHLDTLSCQMRGRFLQSTNLSLRHY